MVTSMRHEKVSQMVKGPKKSGPKKTADVSEKLQKPGRYVQWCPKILEIELW